MIGEANIYGVYVPVLLVWAVVALVISLPVRWVLSRLGAYRLVWHRGLFDSCLVVILWAGVAATAGALWPAAK